MIQTNVENLNRYSALNPYFPAAFAALKELAEKPFVKGRHEVDGDNIYVNAIEYDTHPLEGALAEAHVQYIDVMWLVSGQEQLAYYPTPGLKEITMEYDAAGDALLAKVEKDSTLVQFRPGSVVILFPEDAHAPGLDLEGTNHVTKLIAKVRMV